MKSSWVALVAAFSIGLAGCPGPGRTDGGDGPTDTRDSGVGDSADTATDTPSSCPSVTFLEPADMAVLGPSSDVDMNCSNGFNTNVRAAVNAPDGTMVELWVNGMSRSSTAVAGAVATFSRVSLDTMGDALLEVRAAGVATACGSRRVTVNCQTPSCSITRPMATTLLLSDSVLSDPLRFAAEFVISTSIEDGQLVELIVDDRTPLTAMAMGGMARFASVPLMPDGPHVVRARCTNRARTAGQSADVTYTVDSAPPSLEVTRPAAMAQIGVTDADPLTPAHEFEVCGRSDAAGQPFSARIAGGMAIVRGTGTVPASSATEVCVMVACPTGSAPFDVEVTVRDSSGNVATRTIGGLTCSSALPSVRIVDPVASVSGTASTYLNASRDADAMAAGLQYTVVACTDRMGMAELSVNGSMIPVASVAVVPATAGSPCATAAFGYVARFPNVTVPPSSPARHLAGDPFPAGPTILARLRDRAGDVGDSGSIPLYVDINPPALTMSYPTCGSLLRPSAGMTDITVPLELATQTIPASLTRQRTGDAPITTPCSTFRVSGVASCGMATLTPGTWTFTATATDPAGNVGAIAPSPCTVTVGNPPTLEFVAPTVGAILTLADDPVPGTPGIQNYTVVLRTNAGLGSTLTLTIGAMAPLSATVSMVGAERRATFGPLTLPEGATLLAGSVTDIALGTGTANSTITVDTSLPQPVTALTASVVARGDRRGGRTTVRWTGSGDPDPGGGPLRTMTSYQVRYSTAAITDATTWAAASPVSYSASPAAPGGSEQVVTSNLLLNAGYFFAVRGVDSAGNLGPIVGTTSAVRLDLIVDMITDTTARIGAGASGGFDINGDGVADVVVGSSTGQARVYRGSATGLSSSAYYLFSSGSEARFGITVQALGDVNGDGLGDFAIGAPAAAAVTSGRVYVYFGRRDGAMGFPAPPASLTEADANIVIQGTGADFNVAGFGTAMASADFNGDGLADIVVGGSAASNGASAGTGAVAIIGGSATRFAMPTTITVPNPMEAQVVIRGTAAAGAFGSTVALLGRAADGDSRDDILIGANDDAANGSSVRVVNGRDFTAATIFLTTADASFRAVGAAGTFSRIVYGCGDLDGDGRTDFGMGALNGNGQAQIYFGMAGGGFGSPATISALAAGDLVGISGSRIFRPAAGRQSLLTADSSAPSDLVLGSRAWAGSSPRVVAFRGRASWAGLTPAMADFNPTVMSTAAAPTLSPVSWVNDIDGDGYGDLVVGQSAEGRFVWIH